MDLVDDSNPTPRLLEMKRPFILQRRISLQHTDATGVIFFASQLVIAFETIEAFLNHNGLPLKKIFDSGYTLPFVHAEADYKKPIMAGDELEIHMETITIGTSSVTTQYRFFPKGSATILGTASLVNVLLDSQRNPTPLFDHLRQAFSSLQ